MGVIKKKTTVRGTEGGVKYVCDVCSADITSTVGGTYIPVTHSRSGLAVTLHSRSETDSVSSPTGPSTLRRRQMQ